MKKLILTLVFVFGFGMFSELSATISDDVKDCFAQAIRDLESFEAYNGTVNDEIGAAILNEAYYICWAGY